jgi:tRNA pseudouridine13 synthase
LRALESFRLLCGDADCDALREFVERVSDGGNGDVSPIILSADADKAHRSVRLLLTLIISLDAWMI